jgi:hypothetical protein
MKNNSKNGKINWNVEKAKFDTLAALNEAVPQWAQITLQQVSSCGIGIGDVIRFEKSDDLWVVTHDGSRSGQGGNSWLIILGKVSSRANGAATTGRFSYHETMEFRQKAERGDAEFSKLKGFRVIVKSKPTPDAPRIATLEKKTFPNYRAVEKQSEVVKQRQAANEAFFAEIKAKAEAREAAKNNQ